MKYLFAMLLIGACAVMCFAENQPTTKPAKLHKFLYVIDGAGSMVDGGKAEVLRNEMKKSIGTLNPTEFFNILIFQDTPDHKGYTSLSPHMIDADGTNKDKLNDFVDKTLTFQGAGSAVPAMEEAVREHPQLIYFLTDGTNDHFKAQVVTDRLKELNKDHAIQVNAYLLLADKDDLKKADIQKSQKLLKAIALQNGGVFREFFASDLK